MTYAKNVVSINKAIDKAYWENLVAKGAGLAYDVKNGNIEKAFDEQYPAGWTEQEMKDVIEETEFINDKKALIAEEIL